MPTNYTANYQLNQWEKSDRVLMDDFNADNAKLDAALAALDSRMTCGTYMGTGVTGTTEEQATVLRLGFRPRLVFIKSEDSGVGVFFAPLNSAIVHHLRGGTALHAAWREDGLSWWLFNSAQTTASSQLNAEGVTYHYVAFR